jgi:DNA-directed RNA polymerase specialized sigma24 family protein
VSGSITQWLHQLSAGNRDAAQPLWEKYVGRLARHARKYLNGSPRQVADEEDVIVNAFDSFCRGAELGRFPRLNDSTDLWAVLVTITERKAINQANFVTRKKRCVEDTYSLSVIDDGQEQSIGPSAWFSARVAELYLDLIGALSDDKLRSIAAWKFEGHTNEEIAAKLDCSLRSVERKLAIIKREWIEANE